MKLSRKERRKKAVEKRLLFITELQERAAEELRKQVPNTEGNIDVEKIVLGIDRWLREKVKANPQGSDWMIEGARAWARDFEAKLLEYVETAKRQG